MRVFKVYAFSGIVHITILAALACWFPAGARVDFQLNRGDSVVLSASLSQSAAPKYEAESLSIALQVPDQAMELARAREMEVTTELERDFLIEATPIEIDRSEYEVDVAKAVVEAPAVDAAKVDPSISRQPSDLDLPSTHTVAKSDLRLQRKVDHQHSHPVSEAAFAAPFQSSAELGSPVDEPPSQYPNNRKPPYPADALLARIEGIVRIRIQIDSSGRVIGVHLERSSGTTSLDQSALRTVRQWRFSPARRSGSAVPYEVIVPVRFTIRD